MSSKYDNNNNANTASTVLASRYITARSAAAAAAANLSAGNSLNSARDRTSSEASHAVVITLSRSLGTGFFSLLS